MSYSIKLILIIASGLILSFHFSTHAEINSNTSLMVSYGTGLNDDFVQSENIESAKQYSLGLTWNSKIDMQKEYINYDKLEVEAYFSKISKEESINLLSVRPVFSFKFNQKSPWYWQFGIGLSYFDSKQLTPAELSTHFQFATVLGLGISLDAMQRNRLTLRYNHYSNAYIKRPNPGIDTLSLDWHWHFSE